MPTSCRHPSALQGALPKATDFTVCQVPRKALFFAGINWWITSEAKNPARYGLQRAAAANLCMQNAKLPAHPSHSYIAVPHSPYVYCCSTRPHECVAVPHFPYVHCDGEALAPPTPVHTHTHAHTQVGVAGVANRGAAPSAVWGAQMDERTTPLRPQTCQPPQGYHGHLRDPSPPRREDRGGPRGDWGVAGAEVPLPCPLQGAATYGAWHWSGEE